MNIQYRGHLLPAFILLFSSCASPVEAVSPTVAPPSTTAAGPPATTSTDLPAEVSANSDSTLFGAIAQGEIQVYSLEPVANAIFKEVMDGFVASGNVLEYQVMRVTVFPTGDGSLYAEITFNVRTTDPSWFADGGTKVADNWIDDKCSRFDFVTTETEFKLMNKRTCN